MSPANIQDSYNFLITSCGALLPILIKLCSFKYFLISFIDTFFKSLYAFNIFFLVPLFFNKILTVFLIFDLPSVYL